MVKIREMSISDITIVSEIDKKVFKNPWPCESFNNMLENKFTHYFIVEKNNLIIGYFGILIILDECQIYNIAIAEEEQNNGYGKKIMRFILDYCVNHKVSYITLEVREYNFKAIYLYDKFGFKKVSRIRDYYSNPSEDGLLMRLDIGENIERHNNISNRNIM